MFIHPHFTFHLWLGFLASTSPPIAPSNPILAIKKERGLIQRSMAGRKVVLFPLPMKGHLNPVLQLATMLHSKGFSISIICTDFDSPDPSNHPDFTFHTISDGLTKSEASLENDTAFFTTLNTKCQEPFKECLSRLASTHKESLTCVITDLFWYSARAVAHELKLHVVVLVPFNLCCFHTFLTFEAINAYRSTQEKEMVVPDLSPLRIKDLPKMNIRDPKQLDELMVNITRELRNSDGVIVNSFKELEAPALAKLEKELTIPMFPCGPFNAFHHELAPSNSPEPQKCMSWLDKQAANSVLYVSLGSVVSINKSEFVELAWGLANSDQPFLWVVRPGLVHGSLGDNLLPDGFMANEKGLVVEWSPQQEVLSHPAVGGFLTHGGWNSILESIRSGMPMICMPFQADQMANARYVSEVWRIGLYFEESMNRFPIQHVVQLLMIDKVGDAIRDNILCLKKKVEQCLEVGGSSYETLENLVEYFSI